MINTLADVAASAPLGLSVVVKATFVVLVGLTMTRLLPRARASVRHLVLSATFVGLLILPVAGAIMPSIDIELAAADAGAVVAQPLAPPASIGGRAANAIEHMSAPLPRTLLPAWPLIIAAAWAAGAVVLLSMLWIALWRLSRLRRGGVPAIELRTMACELRMNTGIGRAVDVMYHEALNAPVTCGIVRPAVLLPADARAWTTHDTRRALIHEFEHVRRGDWAIQGVAYLGCVIYWFHPLVWAAWRRLCLEAERACDDAVVRTCEQTDYAEQLVTLARRIRRPLAPSVLGMANRSDLAARVSALLDGRQHRGPAGRLAAAGAVVAAVVIVFGIAPVRAVRAAQSGGRAVTYVYLEIGQREVSRLDRMLYRAAERGNLNRIVELLEAGANINSAIDGDGSPLIGAARGGHVEAVRLLLDRGADINMGVEGDGNPLIMAAHEGHVELVELLLDRGAEVEQIVPGDENALIQSSGEGHLDVVRLLVSRGANVNARAWVDFGYGRTGGEWRTALSMARRGRHDGVVQFLLSRGAQD